MNDSITLADQTDYRLTLHRANKKESEKLIVTFGNISSGISESGFGTEFALMNNWDTVYVAQRENSQYQGLSIKNFFEAICDVATGKDIVCYGSSLGGYAALYYGGSINARIISASPLNSAMPDFLIKKFANLKFIHEPLSAVPTSVHAPVVFYDSTSIRDSRVVTDKVLPAYPAARLVKMPYAGHGVLETMLHAKVLKRVIGELMKSDTLIDFEIPTETSEIWHANVGISLMQLDSLKALQHLERSLEIRPNHQAYNRMVRLLVDIGQIEKAQKMIDSPPTIGARRLSLSPGSKTFVERKGLRSS